MAAAKVQSVQESGLHGSLVDVECQLTQGLPGVVIVGLAGKSLDEAKERLKSACISSGLPLPRKRITLNLAPADLPKEGGGFDVALAASVFIADGRIKQPDSTSVFIGELGLDGTIRPVRGIIGKLLSAKENGFKKAYIPAGNLPQAMLIKGFKLVPLDSLKNLYSCLSGATQEQTIESTGVEVSKLKQQPLAFKDVVGQERSKRALLISAAGRHNIILNGPPGVGKSMLAKAMADIMPPLSAEESVVVTHLHSLAERDYDSIVSKRPVRSPHHTASSTSVVGGGQNPRPGEISLAHGGILFLDELPEFHRDIIESLRQPLEDKEIRVSRAKHSVLYPANFILVATRNPCPCGFFGSSKPCSCTPYQILQYEKKLSGPILDRIDLHVQVDEVDNSKLLATDSNDQEASKAIFKQLQKALDAQKQRFNSDSVFNSDMNNSELKRYANMDDEAKTLLDVATQKLGLSARVYMRSLRVARTIADLDGSAKVSTSHVSEALQYRPHTNKI